MKTVKSTTFICLQWVTSAKSAFEVGDLWSMDFPKTGDFIVPEQVVGGVTAYYNEPLRWPESLNVNPGDRIHVYVGPYSDRDMG